MWNRKSHALLVRIQKHTRTLCNRLEVSCKAKQSHVIQQSHSMVFIQMSLKTFIHTKTCTQILKASLFIIFKTWTKYPSKSEGTNNCAWVRWNIIKQSNELASLEETWGNKMHIPMQETNLKGLYTVGI